MDAAVLVGLLLLVALTKLPLLGTPYYWDETLWIGFAHRLARLELWRVLPGLHEPFEFGNRPPGLFLPMATLFKLTGFSIWLSHLVILAFAFVGVWYSYRLASLWYGRLAGAFAALFLFLNATYFAQSAMFLADLPVAALAVTTIYYGVQRRFRRYWLSTVCLLSLKEPAMAVVGALAAWAFLTRLRSPAVALREAARYGGPLAVAGLYYLWQWHVTGYAFAHYTYEFEPFRWDLGAAREQLPLVHRWLLVEQGRWVFSVVILAALARPAFRRRKELLLLALVLLGAGYAYAFLYFLPRYILPVAPLFYVVSAGALMALVRGAVPRLIGGTLLVVMLAGRLEEQPPKGNLEWNMGYLRIVRVHQEASGFIEREFSEATVWTEFPFAAILSRPELGYVRDPMVVAPLPHGSIDARPPADLIVVGEPSTTDPLERYARRQGLARLGHFGAGEVYVTVYSAVDSAASR